MDIKYLKDYKHNYVVIKDDRVLENDYQLKMLSQNKIEGLLNCQERMINGEGLLYYEVTSYHSLKMLFDNKCLNMDDLVNIINALNEVLNNISRYLLREDKLILDPEYIYMDIETKKCHFLYYPFYSDDKNSFLALTEYLVERINNDDMKVVEAAYQLMDVITSHQLSMSEAVNWFIKEFDDIKETPSEKKYKEEINFDDNDFFKDDDEFEEELSFFEKIKRLIFHSKYDDSTEDAVLYDNEYENNQIEDESTVYIPWVKNSEGKLYGIGPNNKYHIELSKAPITIGKLQGMVDMVISEKSISRIHAKIFRQGSRYCLQDMNSTNGSYKNGIRLTPNEVVNIDPGDEIGLGKLKFVYR